MFNKKSKLIRLLTEETKRNEVDAIQYQKEIDGFKYQVKKYQGAIVNWKSMHEQTVLENEGLKEQITSLTRKRDSSGKYVGKVKSVKKLEPFKIRVTPEESRIVQEVLFENGYEWGLNGRNVVNTEQPFLLIDMDDDLICYMKDGCDNQFCNLREPEITFSQFKSIYKIK